MIYYVFDYSSLVVGGDMYLVKIVGLYIMVIKKTLDKFLFFEIVNVYFVENLTKKYLSSNLYRILKSLKSVKNISLGMLHEYRCIPPNSTSS